MKLSSRKRRLIVGGAVIAMLVGAVGAYAFFTAGGTGTGNGNVGSSAAWTSTQTGSAGTLFPGTATETVTFTVTNNGSGFQNLDGVTATVRSTGGFITDSASSTVITNCSASWFSVSAFTLVPPTDVAPGGTVTVSTVLSMIDSGTNQDPCEGKDPVIDLTFS